MRNKRALVSLMMLLFCIQADADFRDWLEELTNKNPKNRAIGQMRPMLI